MKITLEIDYDGSFYEATCSCGKWITTMTDRELIFHAWGQHVQEDHRPKGVDAADQT